MAQAIFMDETVEGLRRLIAQYRERLEEGENADMVIFSIQAIRDAERKLAELERRNRKVASSESLPTENRS